MARELVFVHGRAQQDKNGDELKEEWLDALRVGLAKSGRTLPIPPSAVHFPYYGDTLRDLVEQPDRPAAEIIVHGDGLSAAEEGFVSAILEETVEELGIADAVTAADPSVLEHGMQDRRWVRAALMALDRAMPGSGAVSIALFTRRTTRALLAASRRASRRHDGIFDVVTALHEHNKHAWDSPLVDEPGDDPIERTETLPLALYL